MKRSLTRQEIATFKKTIYAYYKRHKRGLPWRARNTTPYQILISELMLQQTQVDRVVDIYQKFIKKFPSIHALAAAPFPEVLKAWSGLGYNRRALYVHQMAKRIVNEFGGSIPRSVEVLQTFSGIGKATAASICAFAFNMPTICIETNIRSVYIHHFFKNETAVTDSMLVPFIEETLDTRSPARWYSALMDYGVYLKKTHPNPARKSSHYLKQSPFEGSERQIRGAILRHLNKKRTVTIREIMKALQVQRDRVVTNMNVLIKEGFIESQGESYVVAQR